MVDIAAPGQSPTVPGPLAARLRIVQPIRRERMAGISQPTSSGKDDKPARHARDAVGLPVNPYTAGWQEDTMAPSNEERIPPQPVTARTQANAQAASPLTSLEAQFITMVEDLSLIHISEP